MTFKSSFKLPLLQPLLGLTFYSHGIYSRYPGLGPRRLQCDAFQLDVLTLITSKDFSELCRPPLFFENSPLKSLEVQHSLAILTLC